MPWYTENMRIDWSLCKSKYSMIELRLEAPGSYHHQ